MGVMFTNLANELGHHLVAWEKLAIIPWRQYLDIMDSTTLRIEIYWDII